MNHTSLIEDLHSYFEEKENKTHEEEMFLSELKTARHYFPITFLHRNDLKSKGFDGESVDDCAMEEIADKMGEAYQENGFWIDLELVAEDIATKLPKTKQQ